MLCYRNLTSIVGVGLQVSVKLLISHLILELGIYRIGSWKGKKDLKYRTGKTNWDPQNHLKHPSMNSISSHCLCSQWHGYPAGATCYLVMELNTHLALQLEKLKAVPEEVELLQSNRMSQQVNDNM